MASLLSNSPAKEAEGRVVGFILGDASGWECGVSNTVGWIDAMGFQREDMINLELKI
jgi:hypothetical protein